MKDSEQVLKIYGDLSGLQSRFSCALQNAHILFSWYTECSKAITDKSELDALFGIIDHMDTLNELLSDYTDDLRYYLHDKLQEDEAEKSNQQRERYLPK